MAVDQVAAAAPPAPSPGRVVAAVGCGVLAVAGLTTIITNAPHLALAGHAWEDAATALLWAFLAGLLARRTRHPITGLFLAIAVCATTSVVAGASSALALPGATALAWLGDWIWALATFAPITLLPAVFPSGRLRARRPVVALSLVALALTCLGLATVDRIELTPTRAVANPLAWAASDILFVGGSVLVVLAAVLAIGGLWRRLLGSQGPERRQLAPVAVAALLTVPVLLASAAVGNDLGAPLQLAVAPLVPGAMTLSILQFHLYDVEWVVRRSLVFLGLTVLVVGGYLLVVQAVANLVHGRTNSLYAVLAAGAVAVAFAPARVALQRLVGRWVYGDRATPDRALTDIRDLLRGAPDITPALDSATARLRPALRLPWVEVRTDDDVAATSGTQPRWALEGPTIVQTFPLVHLGVEEGNLRLVPRSPHEALDAQDLTLLTELTALVAAILSAHRLAADLQRSREGVVLAREEERRRIRRDLHDGIGPLLSALSTHADVGLLRMERDPASVPEVLTRVQQLSEQAVTGLRRVVDGLQPAALDELGLDGALHQLAASLSAGTASVRVEGSSGPDLPAAVEVATHRIVAEAVTNALRHGDAHDVVVRLGRSPARLDVEVADDGHGILGPGDGGVGLTSMRERAAELRAALTVETSTAGTVVRVAFPLRSD